MTRHKWKAYDTKLLNTIPEDLREVSGLYLAVASTGHCRTLGIHWETGQDEFFIFIPRCVDALGWLKTSLARLRCIRLSTSSDKVPVQHWRYLNTAHNPADFISRGTTPKELTDNTLWWYGYLCLHAASDLGES